MLASGKVGGLGPREIWIFMCEAKMHYAEVVVYFHYQKCLWLVNSLFADI